MVYPLSARPTLVVDEHGTAHASVVECSEGGLSFEAPINWRRIDLGSQLCGRLEFARAQSANRGEEDPAAAASHVLAVVGEVVRVTGRLMVVRLDPPGIPFGTLLREQLALRAQYPGWPAQDSADPNATYRTLKLEP
ncbi:MAG TPA: hypothetical protein VIG47_04185 [Gemmatimonadaceae bacterium]